MSESPLKLIVLTGSDRPEVLETWKTLVPDLDAMSGVDVVGAFSREQDIDDNVEADLAVILGGDGSILRGCRQLGHRQIPIVGINLGRLGFLADLTPEEFRNNLARLRKGDYEVVEHLMFQCQHQFADGTSATDLGLNEITITCWCFTDDARYQPGDRSRTDHDLQLRWIDHQYARRLNGAQFVGRRPDSATGSPGVQHHADLSSHANGQTDR